MRYKSFDGLAIKADGGDGIIEAYVSVFGNVDSYKDRVMHGAFSRSLATRTPKVWLQHDPNQPIGIHLDAAEVAAGDKSLPDKLKPYGGLWVRAHLNLNTILGKDAYEHLKFGSISEFSFGFEVMQSEPQDDGTVKLTDLELWEYSPVSIGANPLTQLDRIKSLSLGEKTELAGLLFPELSDHAVRYADMRQNAGRVLSSAIRERFGTLADGLKEAIKNATLVEKDLRQILRDTEPAKVDEALTLIERKRKLKLRGLTTQ